MEIISLILIGLSLSMDAFTLSLTYGLLSVPKRRVLLVSLSVGIFHFIMPLLGMQIGNVINMIVHTNFKIILILVLIIILIESIKSLKEETDKEYDLNLINIIIFSILVSFDSFSVGIGLKYITDNIYLGSLIFTILSFTFTYAGFTLGSILKSKTMENSKLLGVILLSITIVYFICK